MIGCLPTRVCKQPIISLYFETVLKFCNLEARVTLRVAQATKGESFLDYFLNFITGFSFQNNELAR